MTKFFYLNFVFVTLILVSVAQADNARPRANENYPKSASYDEGTALTRPNALSVELLGRAGLYSINYDRSLSDQFGLGIGFSGYSLSSNNSSAAVLIFPLYGNFYFQPGPSRGFITVGFDIVTVSANLTGTTFTGSGAAPVIGGGYEYRGTSGFLFRAAPYLIVGTGQVALTIGLSFGYAF